MAALGQQLDRGRYAMTFSQNAAGPTLLIQPGEFLGSAGAAPVFRATPGGAPGPTLHLLYLSAVVTAGGTTSELSITDGSGGLVLLSLATTTVGATDSALYMTAFKKLEGYALTPGNGLYASQSGTPGTVSISVIFEVR